jgi:hypothetical protein
MTLYGGPIRERMSRSEQTSQIDSALAATRKKIMAIDAEIDECKRQYDYDPWRSMQRRHSLSHARVNLENDLARLQQAQRNNGGVAADAWRPSPNGFFHGSDFSACEMAMKPHSASSVSARRRSGRPPARKRSR